MHMWGIGEEACEGDDGYKELPNVYIRMYICMHIYINEYIYINIHIHIYIYMYIHLEELCITMYMYKNI